MSDEMTIRLDSEEYVLRSEGGSLRVGRRVAGEVSWLDDVDPAVLPEDARAALERGDTGDGTLRTALLGIVQAEVQRGG
ncbi:hypothetical protein ACI782_02955 [Geodermatophilus sp. SYSU D00703]